MAPGGTQRHRAASSRLTCAIAPLLLIAALLVLSSATSPAQAALLDPGDVLSPAPLKAGPVGGTVLDTLVSPVVSASFTGTLTVNVIDDQSNPLGGLTFTFGLANDPGSDHAVGRLTLNDFREFLLDASYLAPGTAPALVDRSDDDGDVVGFSFVRAPVGLGTIDAGGSSALLVIQTNAPGYTTSTAAVINGSAAVVPSLAPVPEPAAAALALVAGSALLLRRGRRGCGARS